MSKTKIKPLSKIDQANYNYLKSIPVDKINLLTHMAIKEYEQKYPELKP